MNIKTKKTINVNCSTAYFYKGLFRYQKHNLFSSKSDIISINIFPQIYFAIKFELVPNFFKFRNAFCCSLSWVSWPLALEYHRADRETKKKTK